MIVGGAHSVGNGRLLALDADWDQYVFGAHKWLMSYEPLGILISRSDSSQSLPCYDTPSQGADFESFNMHAVAAFSSALKMLMSVGLDTFGLDQEI